MSNKIQIKLSDLMSAIDSLKSRLYYYSYPATQYPPLEITISKEDMEIGNLIDILNISIMNPNVTEGVEKISIEIPHYTEETKPTLTTQRTYKIE